MLGNKKILLGITGGIAAYKAVDLASRLTASSCQVKTVMTANACEFIQPLTIRSITHQDVVTEYFRQDGNIEHISLADWADLVVIAPATANMIGKVASGIADDLLSTTIMATRAPVLFVPAMNVHMYENHLVRRNIRILSELGYYFMEPETGMLACGYEGKGRFPPVAEIIHFIRTYLHYGKDLTGRKMLVTAGATREHLDPMRFISNHSSGLMGISLARAARIRGAEVHLIAANPLPSLPYYLHCSKVDTAEEMHRETLKAFPGTDYVFMTAAVSDYTPARKSEHKIKKGKNLDLELVRTRDILGELGEKKVKGQILVGFAAESESIRENALSKLKSKKLDFIIANDLETAGSLNTEITILTDSSETSFRGSKEVIAHRILDRIIHEK